MSDDNSIQNPGPEDPSLNETELNDWVKALYETCDTNWRFFLDYRQKFLFRFIVTAAAVFILGSWLWNNCLWEYLWIPPLFLGILSWVFFQIEQRTSTVLVGCHFVGDRIERSFAKRLRSVLQHESSRSFNPHLRKKLFSSERKRQWDALVLAAEEHRSHDRQTSESAATVIGDESKIPPNPIGFFTALTVNFDRVPSHAATLRRLYAWTSLISILISAVLLALQISSGTSWLETLTQEGTLTITGAAVLAIVAILLTVVIWAVIHQGTVAQSLRSVRQQPGREKKKDETNG